MRAARVAVVGFGLVAACGAEPPSHGGLTAQRRHDRLALIRDTSAQLGVYNAALIGGIAVSETNLAHCWSEATYACQGPDSPSCDGPIIAGSADGPCADMQGGLGMFQFDAGTWSETLATYGDAILDEAGNTAQAVAFVVDKVMHDVPGATTWLAATDWINRVPLVAGEATTEQWAQLLACRYNGCCADSALCRTRGDGYRDHAIALVDELGPAFWQTADRCAALPDGGVIAPRTDCYLAAGDPRTWHSEPDASTGGTREWALTTAAGAPASFARWQLHLTAGRYHLEIVAAGGAAAASYQIAHAGMIDPIAIDQATATGFVALGDFDFQGTGDEYVELTTTGAPAGAKQVFGALRATPL